MRRSLHLTQPRTLGMSDPCGPPADQTLTPPIGCSTTQQGIHVMRTHLTDSRCCSPPKSCRARMRGATLYTKISHAYQERHATCVPFNATSGTCKHLAWRTTLPIGARNTCTAHVYGCSFLSHPWASLLYDTQTGRGNRSQHPQRVEDSVRELNPKKDGGDYVGYHATAAPSLGATHEGGYVDNLYTSPLCARYLITAHNFNSCIHIFSVYVCE